jgi:hypothetical protein
MTTPDPWDEFIAGDYIKFTNIGDTVEGTLVARQTGTDFDGNPCPQIVLNVGGELKTVSGGSRGLKRALAAEKDALIPGATVKIGYVADVDSLTKGFAPSKQFRVKVTPPAATSGSTDTAWDDTAF